MSSINQNALAVTDTDARRTAILELVRDNGIVRVSELSQRFGISEVSIRRDLAKLEESGLLRRVHGGAVSVSAAIMPQSYEARMKRHIEEKKRIGQVAADLVQPGDCITLDSGTTVWQVARHIARIAPERKPLTIVTASLPVFRELAPVRDVQLFVLGGIYQPDFQTLVGPHTLANLRGFHVDKLFLGSDGLSLEHGVTTANVLEAEVSRAMVQTATEIIIVSDSSKINSVGFTTVIPLSRISKLITDHGAPDDFVAALRCQGVEVLLV